MIRVSFSSANLFSNFVMFDRLLSDQIFVGLASFPAALENLESRLWQFGRIKVVSAILTRNCMLVTIFSTL